MDVPIIYKAADWWRGSHPPTDISLDPTMLWVLLFSFLTFLVLFAYLFLERLALGNAEHGVRELRFALRRSGYNPGIGD